MKQVPYWLDTAPPAPNYSNLELPDQTEVAVIGGGLTGLSAAIHLAKKGARVTVLEGKSFGWGGSGRNGGMCTTGLTISLPNAVRRYGLDRAKEMHFAFNSAIELVERLVAEEGIDCNFSRTGKLELACKPAHYDELAELHDLLAARLGYQTELIPPARLHDVIGSDAYVGAWVDPLGAGLHVGKFVRGLVRVADTLGVQLRESTRVLGLRRSDGKAHDVLTTRGTIRASRVVVATDAYTDGAFPLFRRRIVPVGSYIIVTEPLDQSVIDELLPKRQMASDSKNLLHYFRATPDNRLLFGGRARFAMSNPAFDHKSTGILQQDMTSIFPQLREVRIDYSWGGSVGMTLDRMPHAGDQDGVFFALGYNGHGVQMATYMGKQIAEMMDGHADANPWRGLAFRPIPMHFGPPWFLPLAGTYYRIKDWIQ